MRVDCAADCVFGAYTQMICINIFECNEAIITIAILNQSAHWVVAARQGSCPDSIPASVLHAKMFVSCKFVCWERVFWWPVICLLLVCLVCMIACLFIDCCLTKSGLLVCCPGCCFLVCSLNGTPGSDSCLFACWLAELICWLSELAG